MTPDAFRELCMRHDLTYVYSDDARAFRAGRDSWLRIQAAAKSVPNAAAIWNDCVDAKMAIGRESHYWEVAA